MSNFQYLSTNKNMWNRCNGKFTEVAFVDPKYLGQTHARAVLKLSIPFAYNTGISARYYITLMYHPVILLDLLEWNEITLDNDSV